MTYPNNNPKQPANKQPGLGRLINKQLSGLSWLSISNIQNIPQNHSMSPKTSPTPLNIKCFQNNSMSQKHHQHH